MMGGLRNRIGVVALVGWLAAQVFSVGLVLWAVVLAGFAWLALPAPVLNALLLAHAMLGDPRRRGALWLGLAVVTLASIGASGFLLFWGAFGLGGGLSGDPTPRGVLLGWILVAAALTLIAAMAMTLWAVLLARRSMKDDERDPETA